MGACHFLSTRTQVFIGGRWRAGANGETLPLLNPSDGSLLAQIARGNAADIDAAVAAAQAALDGDWGRLTRRRARPRADADGRARARRRPTNWRGSRRSTSASR